MSNFKNSRAKGFLEKLPVLALDSEGDVLSARCKFNFHYFVGDAPGQNWQDWGLDRLAKLMGKISDYSESSLKYWENQRIGGSGRVLAIYDKFPANSDFSHPKSVPHDVRWGRFRLESDMRLIGFVVPSVFDDRCHATTKQRFCSNTFYVVFLDEKHKFYKSEDA